MYTHPTTVYSPKYLIQLTLNYLQATDRRADYTCAARFLKGKKICNYLPCRENSEASSEGLQEGPQGP
jgi:hypothetical protein